MFQIGVLIVFCGLLAQTTGKLGGLLPKQALPLAPALDIAKLEDIASLPKQALPLAPALDIAKLEDIASLPKQALPLAPALDIAKLEDIASLPKQALPLAVTPATALLKALASLHNQELPSVPTLATAQLEGLPSLQDLALPLAPALVLDQSPTVLLGNLTNALGSGLTSGGLLGSLQSLPLTNFLDPKGGLVGGFLVQMNPILKAIGLKITKAKLLELGIVPSPDSDHLYATIPVGLNISLNYPLVGSLAEGTVDLNINAEIRTEQNEQGNVHLVVGDCKNSPGSVNITVLNGNFPSINNIVNTVKGFLTNVLPGLVQKQVCPVINNILSNLDVTLVNNIANQLIKALDVVITV